MTYRKRATCTIILIALNVVYFLILSFGGMTEDGYYLLEHGAVYVPNVIEYKEYYRLFASIFLHFDIQHLMNNMITLGVVGTNVEPVVGKVRFLIIYFVSGLGGNLLSLVFELKTQDYAISAGASGAIFGLTGALLCLAILNRGRIGNVTRQGMLFMIGISLYLGFVGEGVDNFAHIGGLLSGVIVTFLIAPRKKLGVRRWQEERTL
ncbi:MAG: rhomboid family intramembrane serine protease [Tyzzerella sp.]|nr:rhomboid family intramembrane serine protease [Tyzzerella sp.]